MRRLVLLTPDPPDATTAAAQYNRRIVAALSEAGMPAERVRLAGRYPAATPPPEDAALCAAVPQDAVIVLDAIAFGLYPALPQVAAGLVHHPSPLYGAQDPFARAELDAAEARALAGLPRLIATSPSVAARLVHFYRVPADRVTVVLPGVNPAPRRVPRGPMPCQILSFGPLVPKRKHDVLLRALCDLTDLDWHLTLIGAADRDPAHAAWLGALITAWGIADRVSLCGPLREPDWDAADILAIAHPVPASTSAILQALRRGIPLAFGAREAAPCPADAAAFCSAGDAPALGRALRRMIAEPALHARMAQAAWQAGAALADWDRQAAVFARAVRGGSINHYNDAKIG